ncbi:endolytic transglycosylase MltG [Mesobacillus harenae]|uniref:endolytic transglycosylase MltG n=1 Tax=Mesobacillus harenae TaxID=2213203 RepID=UPI001580A93D|nr:endolytic transglycosylase MltG [Mesobacillus harenae]
MSDQKKVTTEKKDKKTVIYEKLIERQNEARIVRRVVFVVAVVLFLLVGSLAGGGYYYITSALKPVDPTSNKTKRVEIPMGSSVTGIGNILEEEGIVRDAKVFKYYVKFKNEAGFMAGEYQMNPSMTFPEIITSLKTGSVEQDVVMKITIPEGKQLEEIAEIVAQKTNQNSEEVLDTLTDKDFIQSMMDKYPDVLTEEILGEQVKYALEGYLFPATYPFYKEDPSIEEIITLMLDKTKSVIEEYRGLINDQDVTVHTLLTMASLIEEEATEKADREKISSVFFNRIEEGMLLQTDPTVLYAHGEHKDRVFYKDTEIDSPYNTYKYKGLPPGPIANAGVMSIEAALAPEETDLLYFLATSTGEVIFTRTLDEHNREKAKHITSQN